MNRVFFNVVGSALLWGVYLASAWVIEEITGFTYDRSVSMLLLAWMAQENWLKTKP